MGTYYYLVNTAKWQYFYPGELLSNNKFNGLLSGLSGQALAILLRDRTLAELHPPAASPASMSVHGLWAGDPVYVVGDDDEHSILHKLLRELVEPGSYAAELLRTHYVDITPVLAIRHFEQGFLNAAESDGVLFANLVQSFTQFDLPSLEHSFIGHFGKDWRRRYDYVMGAMPPSETRRLWDLEAVRTMLSPKRHT